MQISITMPSAHISSHKAASPFQCLGANTGMVISTFPAFNFICSSQKQQKQQLREAGEGVYSNLKYHLRRKSSSALSLQFFEVIYCLPFSNNSKAFVDFISLVLNGTYDIIKHFAIIFVKWLKSHKPTWKQQLCKMLFSFDKPFSIRKYFWVFF